MQRQSRTGVTYEFGLDPHSERETLSNSGSWIFFTGTFSAGGSGTLTRFAILRYDTASKTIQNLLPEADATNVSDYAVWHLPEISPYPALLVAEFFWNFDAGETHFDRHQYDVTAWLFNPAKRLYEKRTQYRTRQKYDGAASKVLKAERNEIVRRLSAR